MRKNTTTQELKGTKYGYMQQYGQITVIKLSERSPTEKEHILCDCFYKILGTATDL